jgi:NADPH2:quinone reductase
MSLPAVMRCIEILQPGPDSRLVLTERPLPTPGRGEVMIRVAAAGINRPDLVQRSGAYPPPPGASDLPGLEVAGSVAQLGPGVTDLALGQPVCALVTGGGYAEFCIAAADLCLNFPRGFDAVAAAALPETYFTVWHNVFQTAGLTAGQSLLVHGGGSGIGTTAIQLGKAFGATVFVTAGGPDKCAACENLGADRAIDHRSQDFVAVTLDLTGGRGVDIILDMVGGDYLPRNLKCLATGGRHVSIAFLHGAKIELNFMPVMLKRLVLTGSTLRPQSLAAKAEIARQLRQQVWPLLDSGRVAPQIFQTLPLASAEEAHRLLERGDHFGKIVLCP